MQNIHSNKCLRRWPGGGGGLFSLFSASFFFWGGGQFGNSCWGGERIVNIVNNNIYNINFLGCAIK